MLVDGWAAVEAVRGSTPRASAVSSWSAGGYLPAEFAGTLREGAARQIAVRVACGVIASIMSAALARWCGRESQ